MDDHAGSYRLVVPCAADGDFTDESDRATAILDEVLTGFGGDAQHVHLAGTSNGGIAAGAQLLGTPIASRRCSARPACSARR